MLFRSYPIQNIALVAAFCVFALAVSGRSASTTLTVAHSMRSATLAVPINAAQNGDLNPRIPIDILRVIDGDTIEVRAHVWLDQQVTTKVRLRSIDAPELHARCAAEVEKANASRLQLINLVGNGKAYLTDIGRDKYGGRVVGNIITLKGENVAANLLNGGHARAYSGGKRASWC